ncbi:hypothetical protein CI610_01208 [invertebrate metagenome]|uniref:Uncharacterized protein n=1 Tax=invertebrate metagenome TaxID=1711999 RepID=A0A2H9T9C5_9ZZZZ
MHKKNLLISTLIAILPSLGTATHLRPHELTQETLESLHIRPVCYFVPRCTKQLYDPKHSKKEPLCEECKNEKEERKKATELKKNAYWYIYDGQTILHYSEEKGWCADRLTDIYGRKIHIPSFDSEDFSAQSIAQSAKEILGLLLNKKHQEFNKTYGEPVYSDTKGSSNPLTLWFEIAPSYETMSQFSRLSDTPIPVHYAVLIINGINIADYLVSQTYASYTNDYAMNPIGTTLIQMEGSQFNLPNSPKIHIERKIIPDAGQYRKKKQPERIAAEEFPALPMTTEPVQSYPCSWPKTKHPINYVRAANKAPLKKSPPQPSIQKTKTGLPERNLTRSHLTREPPPH